MFMTTPQRSEAMGLRFVIPAAIRCWFHVHEERVGRFGMQVQRHILATPPRGSRILVDRTPCDRILSLDAEIIVPDRIALDRSWCRICAARVRFTAHERGTVVEGLPWRM
jgi:hypothetical protein